jgi:hypothetical protein
VITAMQNTISRESILAGDKLAALYSAELRAAGFTPKKCPSVTPERLLAASFQNGALNEVVLPFGRLSKWAATFKGGTLFTILFNDGIARLSTLDGKSYVGFCDRRKEQGLPAGEVPPVRFDDHDHAGPEFHLITPANAAEMLGNMKTQRESAAMAKRREKEMLAKRALKLAAAEHCANLAKLAGGVAAALADANRRRRLLRELRAALHPLTVDCPRFVPFDQIPSHANFAEHVRRAQEALADYKPRMICDAWSASVYKWSAAERKENSKPVYGPKFDALKHDLAQAERRLADWITGQFNALCDSEGLPKLGFSWLRRSDYTRARLAVRRWPAKKLALASDYVLALQARRAKAPAAITAAPAPITSGAVAWVPGTYRIHSTDKELTPADLETDGLIANGIFGITGEPESKLTHVPSGRALPRSGDLSWRQRKTLAERMLALPVDWAGITALSSVGAMVDGRLLGDIYNETFAEIQSAPVLP